MIVERDESTRMETNVSGRKIAMRVDGESMAHVMSLLTNAYSDPELACVREYSTNARDSHVQAGQTRPVEVTAPSALSPFLRIRDYGLGMSVDEVAATYSQYGASTKRNSNDVNGCLGIGCKAALAYTSQFTVIATKGGRAATISVARDDEGVGTMTVVSERVPSFGADVPPDGVEVVIPCRPGNKIREKAEAFFRAWEPGTVLLGGAEPSRFEGIWVGDSMIVVEGHQDYVVMGGVPYPVERERIVHELPRGYSHGSALVAFVPIGDVSFPPSREALSYTTRTLTTLKRIGIEFRANRHAATQRAIDAAQDEAGAIRAMVAATKLLNIPSTSLAGGLPSYHWRGRPLPVSVKLGEHARVLYPQGSRQAAVSELRSDQWEGSVLVHGCTLKRLNSRHRDRMAKLAESRGVNGPSRFVVTEEPVDLEWIGPDRRFSWDDVKATRLELAPRAPSTGQSKALPGSYEVIRHPGGTRGMLGSDLDLTAPVYHAPPVPRQMAICYSRVIHQLEPDAQVVLLAAYRRGKFLRAVPTARPAHARVKQAFKEWENYLTPDQRVYVAARRMGATSKLREVDPARVDDPVLAAAARACRAGLGVDGEKLLEWFEVASRGGVADILPAWKSPLDSYPLYDVGYYACDSEARGLVENHRYIMINAVYAANKEVENV